MHIWLIEIGDPLPILVKQRMLRSAELVERLRHRGHRVTWWACDFSHQTKSYVGEPNSRLTTGSTEIVLVHGPGYQKHIGLRRIWHCLAHALNLAKLIEDAPKPDIILCDMPTIESAVVAKNYAVRHSIPLVIDIRDEYPEDFVRATPAPFKFAVRALTYPYKAALRYACKSAAAITAVSERQMNYGLMQVQRHRTNEDQIFHTGARRIDTSTTGYQLALEKWKSESFIKDRFVCTFSGALGPARPLRPIIEAVKRMSAHIPISLVIAGAGDLDQSYRELAAGFNSIVFTGWLGATELQALYGASDVLLAPYVPDWGFSMPTKIFDYISAGRPLVSSCPAEAEQLLKAESIGIQYTYDDSDSFENAINTLYRDREMRIRMGVRARQVFEERFEIVGILDRYVTHLEHLAGA